jgi:parallel beta-helix repeat protein
MTVIANPPYPSYFDVDGSPLEDGYIYFGAANQNPETNPITVYWDAAYTQPALQPIRTSGGFTYRAGTPANIYVSTDFSITVRDKNLRLVYSKLLSEGQTTAEVNLQYSTQAITATAAQTVFGLSTAYTPGNNSLAVYHNGSRLIVGQDYTETTSTSITLAIGATAGDVLQFVTATPINPSSLGAAAVAYVPAGAGAVATNVQAKLREVVSVKDFGANPSNTAAVNLASINSALASGALSVSIPDDGIYLVSGTVTVPSGVSLLGLGKGSIKLADGSVATSTPVISLGSGASIRDITVDANRQNNTGDVSGIYSLSPNGLTVSGCTVLNSEYGIRVTNGFDIVITDNTVNDCRFYGISVKLASTSDSCSRVIITGNTCKNIASDGTAGADGQGIVVYGATGVLLANYKNITDVVVSNNICGNCAAHGITLIAVSDYVVSGNNCYDCAQNTTFGSGICISEACVNGTVSNNTTSGCYDAGILLDVVDQTPAGNRFNYGYMSVVGNSCRNNVRAGIKVNSMPHTTITGNNCTGSLWGIFIAKGGFNEISNNTISYCSENGIRLPGLVGATGNDQTNVVISGNIIDNCTGATGKNYGAIYATYFSAVKIQGNQFSGNTQDLGIDSTCTGVTLLDNRFTSDIYVDSSASIQRWVDEFRTTMGSKLFYATDFGGDGRASFRVDAAFTVPHFGLEWVPLLSVANVTSSLTTAIATGGYRGQKLRLINVNTFTITLKHNAAIKNIGSVDVVLSYGEVVEYIWTGTVWAQTLAKVATTI